MTNTLAVRIYETRQEMGDAAAKATAEKINELLQNKKEVNIIFAAAPSQNEFLASLIKKEIDWTRVNAFHMDEYIGLNATAPQLFGNFLKDRIFGLLPFKTINYLNGNAANIEEECSRYEKLLMDNATDVVCMGIGENGHIAFNDPHVADFNDTKLVKIVNLDQPCRQQQVNDGCFNALSFVPTHALTLTVPALMKAKHVFCMVPGALKANAVYNTLHQPLSAQYPSTIIRNHPSAILFLDKKSAENIKTNIYI